MKTKLPPPNNPTQQPGISQRTGQKHFEFELEPATLRKIEVLARKARCTPFELCVTFLRERISFSDAT